MRYTSCIVLLYNCGSWAAPKHILTKLDTCHRKHLRRILNIFWPKGVIRNCELYRRCRAVPVTERVKKARWTLLGHILRMDDNCPPVQALKFALDSSSMFFGRSGRPRITLLNTIQADLKTHGIKFFDIDDFETVRHIASDKVKWRNMFK